MNEEVGRKRVGAESKRVGYSQMADFLRLATVSVAVSVEFLVAESDLLDRPMAERRSKPAGRASSP